MSRSPALTRRRLVAGIAALPAAAALWPAVGRADGSIHTRTIATSGARIPAIGMGTWITFNVGADPALRAQRTDVLRAFFAAGGGLIDSSPMYGSSEAVVGHGLAALGIPDGLISATKVWTPMGFLGGPQMDESRDLWGLRTFDVMQVHNLLDWQDHLETLREDKAQGRIRHIGMTTSHGRRHAEMERIIRDVPDLDTMQITYNAVDREAENRLLPLAAERGLGVIVNRPFRQKELIRHVAGHSLPSWAEAEAGARTWPEFLLKFIIGHPAVTCAIPATTRVDHMRENMAALHGPLPDAATRRRMAAYVEDL